MPTNTCLNASLGLGEEQENKHGAQLISGLGLLDVAAVDQIHEYIVSFLRRATQHLKTPLTLRKGHKHTAAIFLFGSRVTISSSFSSQYEVSTN